MQSILNGKKLILSSGSPRRKELLELSGITPYDKRVKEIDETYSPEMDVTQVASFLAREKAMAFDHIADDEVYITADTIVICNDKIYGKPKDRQDAIETLTTLSGIEHTVITGVCLRSSSETYVFDDVSRVKIAEMSQEEIEYYIDTCQPFDKAGSYGIQDWLGVCKVEYIYGSYSNIMGMPMQKVYEELKEFCA